MPAVRFHGLLRAARRQPHRPKHRRGLQREHIFHALLGCRLALAIRPNDVAEVGVMQGSEHIVIIRFLVHDVQGLDTLRKSCGHLQRHLLPPGMRARRHTA